MYHIPANGVLWVVCSTFVVQRQFQYVFSYMPIYADYMSLPAYARRCCSNQSISPALPIGPTAANLQQRVCCCGRTLEQTDGQTPYLLILYGHAVPTLMLEPGGTGPQI